MVAGNTSIFSVNWAISKVVDGWVLGQFFFLIDGVVVGDPSDHSVDLKGCLRWLRDFVAIERSRYEPGLYDMDSEQLFLRLASSVLTNEDGNNFVPEFYEDTFARFHISHLGMSSFDRVTLLLIESEQGLERLVWKTSRGEVLDAHLEIGEVKRVLSEVANLLEAAISSDALRK